MFFWVLFTHRMKAAAPSGFAQPSTMEKACGYTYTLFASASGPAGSGTMPTSNGLVFGNSLPTIIASLLLSHASNMLSFSSIMTKPLVPIQEANALMVLMTGCACRLEVTVPFAWSMLSREVPLATMNWFRISAQPPKPHWLMVPSVVLVKARPTSSNLSQVHSPLRKSSSGWVRPSRSNRSRLYMMYLR